MKIEHIAMYVKDLEKTKTFFEIYLNARANAGYYNPKTDFRSYFLSFDDGARLEIMNKPQMQDSPKDELTAKLKEDGYEIISGPRITGDGYYESCVVGIEGNQIEITV